MKDFKITHYKYIGKGSITCSFTLTVPAWGGFQIRGITCFEGQGKRWLSMPSRAYDDPKEPQKKNYFAYVGFEDRALNDAFQAKIMKTLDDHVKSLAPNDKNMAASKAAGDGDDLPF